MDGKFSPKLWAGFTSSRGTAPSTPSLSNSTSSRSESLLPQISSSGFSVNYALLNISGFFFYTLYNTVGLIDHDIGTGKIEIQDMFFTYNAFMMTSLQLTQSMIYPRGTQ